MFRIGDFSRIARVSCRLLRYYDELGLLKPALVDAQTGYRSYSAAQLPRLNRILVMKELGFSLEQIVRVIDQEASAAELRAMLQLRRADAEQALSLQAARLRQIEARIAQIDAPDAIDDVVIRAEAARAVLTMRTVIPSFDAARTLLKRLVDEVPRRVPKGRLGSLLAIAHSGEFEPDAIDVEFGYVLDGPFDGALRLADGSVLRRRELPAVETMAACVRIGLPEQAHAVTARIGRYVEANGFRLDGASREVFLQPPQLERMDQSVVEMQFPVTRL